MKSLRSFVLFFAIATPLLGCSNEPGPGDVVLEFAQAFSAGEIDVAMSHLSAEVDAIGRDKVRGTLAGMINEIRAMGADQTEEDDLEIVSETVHEATARVTLRTYSEGFDPIDQEFVLNRENGEWKISLQALSESMPALF